MWKMYIDYEGCRFGYINEGANGSIFQCAERNSVLKIFHACATYEHASAICQDQIAAYQLISNSEISQLAPKFIGGLSSAISVLNIPDNHFGFHGSIGFEMEYVAGSFQKTGADCTLDELNRVRELLRSYGVNGVSDISVHVLGGEIVKIVDFSMNEQNQRPVYPAYILPPSSGATQ